MGRTWLFSKWQDLLLLFLPVWLCWLFCFVAPEELHKAHLPILIWVIFVLGIDVSHVWSTIFRTYLDKDEWKVRSKTLILLPFLSFVVLFLLAYFSMTFFWRCMAYLALFHFMKQQFGFMAYYNAIAEGKIKKRIKDKWVVYLGMLYPVFYWHVSGNRDFSWFASGDFLSLTSKNILNYVYWLEIVYWLVLLLWLIEELWLRKKNNKPQKWGMIIWVITTWFNWYLGIVYFNSDLAFTLTNVVAHGIPYLALIIHYYISKKEVTTRIKMTHEKVIQIVVMIIGSVLLLAFFEELFWDNYVNQEKGEFFHLVSDYFATPSKNAVLLALTFAILSLPQVTHYLLDALIWKVNKSNPFVKKTIIKS